MPRIINITGEKFGRLTVIEITSKRQDGCVVWKCLCDCGNFIEVNTRRLKSGNTKSCGCLHSEIVSQRMRKDISNQKFGNLTAITPTEERKHGSVIWKCLCDCGNEHFTSAELLLSGNTKSCGCIRSRGNQKIKEILQSMDINFLSEYFVIIDNIRYSYDFAIFQDSNLICLIEYDGILHYEFEKNRGWNNSQNWEKTKINDNIKNNYASRIHVPLIRIPYWEYDNLNKKFLEERIKKECYIVDIL